MPQDLETHVVIFAREPVPGEVKTRLALAIGPDAAARLHHRLVARTVVTARRAGLGPVTLCVTPDDGHPLLEALAARHGVDLTTQGEGDLGARMARALRTALSDSPRALLVGSDCPTLSAAYLRAGAAALDRADAVLGPAEDGGYVLIGLRGAASDALFTGIRWGGDDVCAAQRARFAAAGIDWRELGTLWDLDRPEDLVRWQAEPAVRDGMA